MVLLLFPLLLAAALLPLAATGYNFLRLFLRSSLRFDKLCRLFTTVGGCALTLILCFLTGFLVNCYTFVTAALLGTSIAAYLWLDRRWHVALHAVVYVGMIVSAYIIYSAFSLTTYGFEVFVACYLSLLPLNFILLGIKTGWNQTAAAITPAIILAAASVVYAFEKNIFFGGFFL